MLRHSMPTLASGLLASLILAVIVSAANTPSVTVHAQDEPSQIPCDPTFTRTMDPLAVEQGDTADVEIEIDYNCRQRGNETVMNVMLVVNTAVANDFNERTGLEKNLRAGMASLINQLPWSNGSRMGLILFDGNALVRSPLRADPDGTSGQREALAQLARNFRLGFGSASGFDRAISLAYRQLPTSIRGELNAVVAFHAGPRDLTVGNWCRQADRVGVTLIGIQVASGGGQLAGCMNAGMSTVPDDGSGLEERFEAVGNALFRGDTIDLIILTDALRNQYVDYVGGSSNLVEPANPFSSDYEWTLPGGRNPPGGRTLSYQVRLKDEDPSLAPDRLEVSHEAKAFILYASGGQLELDMHVPFVCLAQSGKLREQCGNFETPTPTPSATLDLPTAEPTLTFTPGPATDTPVATDTPDPPTETPTPSVSDTPVPTETDTPEPTEEPPGGIFLPFLAHTHRLEP